MGTRLIACILSCLLALTDVTGFSISRRSARNTGLSDGLDILQRQRRRVGADYFLGSERLGEGRPLTLDDVTDWLSTNDERGDLKSDWLSDRGNFKEFDGGEVLDSAYDLPPLLPPPKRAYESEEVSRSELEDIFSDDREDDIAEKKKKVEIINVKKGEQETLKKKSVNSDNLLLDTLPMEEFQALMKAVGKLRKQANKLGEQSIHHDVDVKETLIESIPVSDDVTVAEPVSEEELKSVFGDSEGPFVKETTITEKAIPGPNGKKTIQRTEATELLPSGMIVDTEDTLKDAIASEIEQDMIEDSETADTARENIEELEDSAKNIDTVSPEKLSSIEKYWLMSDYMENDRPLQKRTAKRAVIIPHDLLGADRDGDNDDAILSSLRENYLDEDENPDTMDEAVLEINRTPTLEPFMVKILKLQGEVDHLRMEAKLEDLENDVLTNALNEATLGQKEGTVSEVEFDSLQNAIRIEEALQDLKASNDEGILPFVEREEVDKRGEPWERKRQPEVHRDSGSPGPSDVISLIGGSKTGFPLTDEKIERLMEKAFLLETSQEDEDGNDQIASLFLPRAASCPAVREYSTDCDLADLYSLPVDYEARALCNLHQMCYSCGHSLHVLRDYCDLVYRAASKALCEEKESCVMESEIFLRAMKLKTRYVPHRLPHCRSTCTAKYLGML